MIPIKGKIATGHRIFDQGLHAPFFLTYIYIYIYIYIYTLTYALFWGFVSLSFARKVHKKLWAISMALTFLLTTKGHDITGWVPEKATFSAHYVAIEKCHMECAPNKWGSANSMASSRFRGKHERNTMMLDLHFGILCFAFWTCRNCRLGLKGAAAGWL